MYIKTFSVISLGLGVFLLVQVAMPMLEFWAWEVALSNSNVALLDPSRVGESAVLGVSVEQRGNFSAIVSSEFRKQAPPYSEFEVDIPRINIKEARVVVDTNEFDENLAHLPGSALPGERGNVFITGHSSLASLFKSGDYKSIFTNLMKLKEGDEITLNVGGVKYEYLVEGLRVVNPKETWVVNPPDEGGRYLTLMTCVPPGLSTNRLVVLARLK